MKSILAHLKIQSKPHKLLLVVLLLGIGLLILDDPIQAQAVFLHKHNALDLDYSSQTRTGKNNIRHNLSLEYLFTTNNTSDEKTMKFYIPLLHKSAIVQMPPTTLTPEPSPTSTQKPSPTSTQKPSPTSTFTATPTTSPGPVPTQTPTQGNDPILFFTSDLVAGGSLSRGQAVVSLIKNLMKQHPGTQVLVASGGDNEQESAPSYNNYQAYFGTTYQTFVNQGIFRQVRGNHDNTSSGSYTDFDGTYHNTGGAYWDYFGPAAQMYNIRGKKLSDYSYDLGSWHIIALDQVSGSVTQASLDFLTSDLAAHASTTCQLVYWHVPTYSSGITHGDSLGLKSYNQAEYNAGVDIQLNGHDHDYQRFYPINPGGVRDNAKGITTFVAGIGGDDDRPGWQKSAAEAASAVYLDSFPGGSGHAIGVVQFVLHADSADYTLYDANNGSILDHGTVVCH